MKIDTHHHFWAYSPEAYPWMTDEIAILKNDYLPPVLKQEIDGAGIDGVITVQVRQSMLENEWMLGMADENDWILGVVGWAPLHEADVGAQLERFAAHNKFKGIRHIVQDEPDDDFILGADFNRGVAQLKALDLVYDILIFEKHLPASIAFVDQHPDQPFVLDHIAKPQIVDGNFEAWASQLKELGKRENVSCKLSGVATEADHKNWTEAQLTPYFEAAFEAFGTDRMMFGSDWPVALLAVEYQAWHDLVARFVDKLSNDEQAAFWEGNARRAYRLS